MVETKGSLLVDALRPTEEAKMKCGEAHFAALDTGVGFVRETSYDGFEGRFEAVD